MNFYKLILGLFIIWSKLDVSFLNKSNTTMEDVNWKISRRLKTIRSNSLEKSASAALLCSVDLSASLAAPVAYLLELTDENCSVLIYLTIYLSCSIN